VANVAATIDVTANIADPKWDRNNQLLRFFPAENCYETPVGAVVSAPERQLLSVTSAVG
jgi:hypothetical protein